MYRPETINQLIGSTLTKHARYDPNVMHLVYIQFREKLMNGFKVIIWKPSANQVAVAKNMRKNVQKFKKRPFELDL